MSNTMKKILFLSLASAFMLTSCSSKPEDSVKNFTENIAKGKVDEAKKYATESTGKLLDFVSGMGGVPVDPNYKFEFVKDSVVDNTAWVTFTNQKGEEETVKVVKIDGKWLVHMESKK